MVRFEFVSLCEDNISPIAAELFRVASRVGRRTLCLDLGRVEYLTGSVLNRLVSLHTTVRKGGGRLVLCNASSSVYEVFEITGLHTLLDINPP
jgi:anti-anti-sigma factor